MINFVSGLRQVGGFLYTTLSDKLCQWLATGWWFSLYNIIKTTNLSQATDKVYHIMLYRENHRPVAIH
jgi:hypothetical protein